MSQSTIGLSQPGEIEDCIKGTLASSCLMAIYVIDMMIWSTCYEEGGEKVLGSLDLFNFCQAITRLYSALAGPP